MLYPAELPGLKCGVGHYIEVQRSNETSVSATQRKRTLKRTSGQANYRQQSARSGRSISIDLPVLICRANHRRAVFILQPINKMFLVQYVGQSIT